MVAKVLRKINLCKKYLIAEAEGDFEVVYTVAYLKLQNFVKYIDTTLSSHPNFAGY